MKFDPILINYSKIKIIRKVPCNPSNWETEAGRSESKDILSNIQSFTAGWGYRNPVSKKIFLKKKKKKNKN